MEDEVLRNKCQRVIEKWKSELSVERQCIAAYLLGSFSHDQIWEWSDIQIALVLDDGYRGRSSYSFIDDGMPVIINLFTLTEFKEFIGTVRVDDFMWKAFSKGLMLFCKDRALDELFGDAFYIGEVDRQKELLLGFSGAVYYLNKAEKNFYVKNDLGNAIYFVFQLAENIAWMEILIGGRIPERELIPQGRRLNPELFSRIYDPLLARRADHEVVGGILENCVAYLENHTRMAYEPVIAYLERYGNLENFRYDTRPHGFGINYEWLVRVGIAERYGIPKKVPFLKTPANQLGYRLKKNR